MGFWSELGKVALGALEASAAADDPRTKQRMKEHMEALLDINTRESGDGLINIIGNSVISAKQNSNYFRNFDRSEIMTLGIYLKNQLHSAENYVEENKYDRDAENYVSNLKLICNVVEAEIRQNHSI